MIVTFCGHRDVTNEAEVKKQLVEIIKKLILRGAKEFYLGGYGHFDLLAAKAVKQLQKEYPQIQSILILPYLNQNYDTRCMMHPFIRQSKQRPKNMPF